MDAVFSELLFASETVTANLIIFRYLKIKKPGTGGETHQMLGRDPCTR